MNSVLGEYWIQGRWSLSNLFMIALQLIMFGEVSCLEIV